MGEVLNFRPKDDEELLLCGVARCSQCKREWEARAPVGTTVLECPECGNFHGRWHGPVVPPKDVQVWVCNHCSNDVFYATRIGLFCTCCSFQHDYASLVD